MKSIDSQYLSSKYQLTRSLDRNNGDDDDDEDDDDDNDEIKRVRKVRTLSDSAACHRGIPCACTYSFMRPVYLRTGARSSLRAIKHKSRVTFIPLWGFFHYPTREPAARFFCRLYPSLSSSQPLPTSRSPLDLRNRFGNRRRSSFSFMYVTLDSKNEQKYLYACAEERIKINIYIIHLKFKLF